MATKHSTSKLGNLAKNRGSILLSCPICFRPFTTCQGDIDRARSPLTCGDRSCRSKLIALGRHERFMNFVSPEPNSGCWLWVGCVDKVTGYGWFGYDGEVWAAHRAAYTMFRGEIPTGLHIDHLCRVRCCVNPDHLEPVTCAENIQRGFSARGPITHCKRGHEFTPENTGVMRSKHRVDRQCLACKKFLARRWYVQNRDKQRAAAA